MDVPTRLPFDEEPSLELPPGALEALGRLAAPPRALPDLVDARIRAAIESHDFAARPWLSRSIAARWAAAAAVAIACGAGLGWLDGQPPQTPATDPTRTAQSDSNAARVGPPLLEPTGIARSRPTIVDAMLAARIAGAARRGDGTGEARGDISPIDAALRARLDADSDGAITLTDARLLAEQAVGRSDAEGSS